MGIEQPKDVEIKAGNLRVKITWAPNFAAQWNGRFERAQRMFDSECMRLCDPLVPMDSGTLKNAAPLASKIGKGELVWQAPYAKRMYYNPQYHFRGAPQRGGRWGERMIAANLQHLQQFAEGALGGKG